MVRKNGNFRIDHDPINLQGFVVSDFISQSIYLFEEGNVEGQFAFQEQDPFIISENEYLEQAQNFLDSFESFEIQKAVLSRVKKVEFDESKTERFFDKLVENYPNAFVYLISSSLFGTWLGATPEVLLYTSLNSGFTMALAGTKKSDDQSEWGVKEYEEQKYVTDFIQDQLIEGDFKNIEVGSPFEVNAGPVKHLRSDISFDIDNNDALKIIRALHPTPAVSGWPQQEAIGLILETEKHDRLFYSGFIGLMNIGKNQIYVNLRCCQIQKGAAFLYLGGGFTKDSIPEEEWLETENKSKTLLNILQKL